LSSYTVTVAVPTLAADEKLVECIHSLKRQTLPGVEVIVVDNSGRGLARDRLERCGEIGGVRIIENKGNQGFGGAVNRAFRSSQAPFLATLNDDAAAGPCWLEAIVKVLRNQPEVGMCASCVRLKDSGKLDSAGMRIAGDGSSKQRGYGSDPRLFEHVQEVLLPSGSAAVYRREIIEDTGGFDEDFFLYCEDTDLGLRARWAGWKCLYVPDAVVDHHYSHTAGAFSAQKAYFVERNRLFLALKTLPARMILLAPFYALARYFWHLVLMFRREGAAAKFAGSPGSLPWIVVKAHLATFAALPLLVAKRRVIRRRISAGEFARILRAHWIGVREVASL
jgi:GT2 family glycosyltransferase